MNILVVDDNQDFCQNIKDIMELNGHSVQTAFTGPEALKSLKAQCPDIVLMDVRMPGMDGVNTFKKMKRIAPALPVVMMTAFALDEVVKDALREGAFGTIKKPPDLDQLLALLREAAPGAPRVLLVDDDRELCSSLKDCLGEKGYHIMIANDGDEALEKAWEYDFDVVLIDMKLPSLNGLETYLAFREIRPRACAVMMTGYPDMEELAEQAVEEEAYTWLEKPVDLGVLAGIVEEARARRDTGARQIP
ncbi:MAG: response regulator [Chloroflexi bacterium]|nr:response regulator [Chloroflexota bacterium]